MCIKIMDRSFSWYFPSGKDLQKKSKNDPGIETYKDNYIYSLAREICQNSLDAVEDDKKPVRIDFKIGELRGNDFPNRDYFYNDVLEKIRNTWNNEDIDLFVTDLKKTLDNESISYLKISDYNTTGLIGANGEGQNTPWKSLIEEVGSSIKNDDSSSGSFGIGKHAPFACSKLRTIFYTTFPKNEGIYSIGVSSMPSFEIEAEYITQGIGYLGNHKKPIQSHFEFDKEYNRKEPGTDIYILGFKDVKWEKQLETSILENFMLSIFENKLVVNIENTIISKETLDEKIHILDETKKNMILKNYYDVLINEKTLTVNFDERFEKYDFKKEDGKLLLLKQQKGNRSVLMTRKAGMKILDKKNISGSIQFSGVFQALGDKINKILKMMENASHDKWVPTRYEMDIELATNLIKDLKDFVKENVINNFADKIEAEVDAYGLSKFLPDSIINPSDNIKLKESKFKDEKIKITHKSMQEETINKEKKARKIYKKSKEENIIDLDGLDDSYDNDSEIKKNKDFMDEFEKDKDFMDLGNQEKNKSNKEPLDLPKIINKKNITFNYNQKVIEENSSNGEYLILFEGKQDFKNIFFEIFLIGEQSNEVPVIVNAISQNQELNFEKNVFEVRNVKENSISELKFKINYNRRVRMGVNVYENKR